MIFLRVKNHNSNWRAKTSADAAAKRRLLLLALFAWGALQLFGLAANGAN
jgi:hypothetical protein